MLEVVEQCSYLDVIITNYGRIDKEINNRIKKANQIYYEINKRKMFIQRLKFRFTKVCIFQP
jgi:hypothetical protein